MPSGIYETIWGHAGRDADIRQTAQGSAVASFSLCANVQCGRSDKAAVWRDIAVFGKHAEFCAGIRKGDLVCVIGRVTLDRYTTRDGTEKESVQIIASEVICGGGDREKPARQNEAQAEQQITERRGDERNDTPDDEIPF